MQEYIYIYIEGQSFSIHRSNKACEEKDLWKLSTRWLRYFYPRTSGRRKMQYLPVGKMVPFLILESFGAESFASIQNLSAVELAWHDVRIHGNGFDEPQWHFRSSCPETQSPCRRWLQIVSWRNPQPMENYDTSQEDPLHPSAWMQHFGSKLSQLPYDSLRWELTGKKRERRNASAKWE